MSKIWTKERIEELRHLRMVKKCTVDQCAEALGMTRGAVSGAFTRYIGREEREVESTRTGAPYIRRESQVTVAAKIGSVAPIIEVEPDPPIVALKKNMCRWPILHQNGPTTFCGRPTTKGPYCEEHSKLAYVKSQRLAHKL